MVRALENDCSGTRRERARAKEFDKEPLHNGSLVGAREQGKCRGEVGGLTKKESK